MSNNFVLGVKPAGEAMRAFAERIAAGELPQRDIAPLKLDPNTWYQDPAGNFERLFHEWSRKL